MLFQGLRLLFANWRLTLDPGVAQRCGSGSRCSTSRRTRSRGRSSTPGTGGVELLLVRGDRPGDRRRASTSMPWFAFAISQPRDAQIRPACRGSRGATSASSWAWGPVDGRSPSDFRSRSWSPRWGVHSFPFDLGIVIGVMMLTYVTVPARIVGIRPGRLPARQACDRGHRRGRSARSSAARPPDREAGDPGARVGAGLFPLGVVLLTLGFVLQAGATGAVKAIKMSEKLAAGHAVGSA